MPPTTNPDPVTAAAATAAAVQTALVAKRVEDLERELTELKADRDKFLRWGVITLGGAVVTLVTYIFNLVTKHN